MSVESTSLWYVLCMYGTARNSKSILIMNTGLILWVLPILTVFSSERKINHHFPFHSFTPPVNIIIFDIIPIPCEIAELKKGRDSYQWQQQLGRWAGGLTGPFIQRSLEFAANIHMIETSYSNDISVSNLHKEPLKVTTFTTLVHNVVHEHIRTFL